MYKFLTFIATIAAFSTGCINHTHDHGDEEGPAPITYTVYSDKSEVFVEFNPLVVGANTAFAAHFTLLGDKFLPLTEGSVTVSLIVGASRIKHTADTPSVPGIYRLSLKPTVAGTGKLVFDIKTPNFTDQLIIENIKVYADEKTALDERPGETGASDIQYLKEQAWKVEFANEPVKKRPFRHIIKTSGQILSAPGDERIVIANANGIVLFSGNRSIIGSEVTTGTILFTITGGEIAGENIDVLFKEAKANYEKAKADFDRASELVKDRIVSEKDYQQIKMEFENAHTAFGAIARNYSVNGQSITASGSGFVKNIFVTEGQYVVAGTPLAVISKNRKLILQANVSQKHFNNLATITSANFKTTENETVYNTQQLNGRVISYGKSVSANAPFIPLTFEIDNAGNLIPGSVVEVYLQSFPVSDALVIPISSLIEEQGSFFVFVQTGGERFQKRDVKLGSGDGIYVQLLSGVAEGERVVTKGAYQIKLAAASGTMPTHGHEH